MKPSEIMMRSVPVWVVSACLILAAGGGSFMAVVGGGFVWLVSCAVSASIRR